MQTKAAKYVQLRLALACKCISGAALALTFMVVVQLVACCWLHMSCAEATGCAQQQDQQQHMSTFSAHLWA